MYVQTHAHKHIHQPNTAHKSYKHTCTQSRTHARLPKPVTGSASICPCLNDEAPPCLRTPKVSPGGATRRHCARVNFAARETQVARRTWHRATGVGTGASYAGTGLIDLPEVTPGGGGSRSDGLVSAAMSSASSPYRVRPLRPRPGPLGRDGGGGIRLPVCV